MRISDDGAEGKRAWELRDDRADATLHSKRHNVVTLELIRIAAARTTAGV
jgi:hypothetical protein